MKLTINNKDYGLSWGMGALEIYCDNMLCDIEGLDLALSKNREQNRAIITLIMAGMQNYSELMSPPQLLDVSFRQVQKFMDDAPQDTLTQILDDFVKSKYLGTTIEEYLLSTMGEPEEPSGETPKKLD